MSHTNYCYYDGDALFHFHFTFLFQTAAAHKLTHHNITVRAMNQEDLIIPRQTEQRKSLCKQDKPVCHGTLSLSE